MPTIFSRLLVAALGVGLAQASAQAQADPVQAAYVVLGDGGTAVARAVTAAACPMLEVDGAARPMTERAAPATLPLRASQSKPELTKPAAFPVRVCETPIAAGAHQARIGTHGLKLPKPRIDRIVVIGDTGCRIKVADDAYQACNDPAAWPFATVAARAAAWKPDLVLHVGDYLYRENACPQGNQGCAGTVWGYGWDAWKTDFFDPAAPLLAAAPWVAVRGNHESCNRAGQGWWRLIDPHALDPGRDCVDADKDDVGDYSPTYSVPLGDDGRIIVLDLSRLGDSELKPDDPKIARAVAQADDLARRAASGARFTIVTDHFPFLAIKGTKDKKTGALSFATGNPAIRQTFGQRDPAYAMPGVDLFLTGHVHMWEQVDYGGRHPSQIVAGFSGTQEDVVPLPEKLPAEAATHHGPIQRWSAITDMFGFMTLERQGATRWQAKIYRVDGRLMRHCTIDGRRSSCLVD